MSFHKANITLDQATAVLSYMGEAGLLRRAKTILSQWYTGGSIGRMGGASADAMWREPRAPYWLAYVDQTITDCPDGETVRKRWDAWGLYRWSQAQTLNVDTEVEQLERQLLRLHPAFVEARELVTQAIDQVKRTRGPLVEETRKLRCAWQRLNRCLAYKRALCWLASQFSIREIYPL